jgi:hypothetical protein
MRCLPLVVILLVVALIGCGASSNQPAEKPEATTKQQPNAKGEKTMPDGSHVEGKPWRSDPLLKGRFHPEFPDDLQVIVHDGGPRLTKNTPELMWVSVVGTSGRAYRGKLLNKPHNLSTIKQGEEILFLAGPRGIDPFRVTPTYLKEREHWHVQPCKKCGMPELFDAPSDLIAVIFPDLKGRKDVAEMSFTTFCPLCRGVQLVSDKPLNETK